MKSKILLSDSDTVLLGGNFFLIFKKSREKCTLIVSSFYIYSVRVIVNMNITCVNQNDITTSELNFMAV